MKTPARVSLRFRRPQEFGTFCEALTEDEVPFIHAGFRTIVLASSQIGHLPAESRRLFEKFQADGSFEQYATSSAGRRTTVSKTEADKVLGQLAERWAKSR